MVNFAQYLRGEKWTEDEAAHFVEVLDRDRDGVLNFDEFVIFCDSLLLADMNDDTFVRQITEDYLQDLERREMAIGKMWHRRAKTMDHIFRLAIPFGFIHNLFKLFRKNEKDLSDLMNDDDAQAWLIIGGLMPLLVISAIVLAYKIAKRWFDGSRRKGKKKKESMTSVVPLSFEEIPRSPTSEISNGAAEVRRRVDDAGGNPNAQELE
eukprot:gnl/TRDRNA2_/TRDRNA2_147218_c0_seq1.p1 gnl/TRDRNA2_/TRDRNA2_147218_c0~~gnl/TRDRNA2_/TRDRNA2_147218_c0_seq1.p1  ORF type:complete len:231 (+),score=32.97 gnl/TRDRNA2_/TRDRNA2_147218_c0_seq1:70-693(+)